MKLTQEAFGALVGLTDVSVRRMETDRQGFSSTTLEKIAVCTHRNWWEIFGYKRPPDEDLDDDTVAAIAIMVRLTPEGRKEALAFPRTVEQLPGRVPGQNNEA